MDSLDQEKAKVVADAERDLARLWRAWRTIHQMCQDRGYELSEEEVSISLEDFRDRFSDPSGAPESASQFPSAPAQHIANPLYSRKKMTTSFKPTTAMMQKYTPLETKANPNPIPIIGTIWIEFSTDQSIGIKQMRNFAHHCSQHNFHTGILITQASITPAALKIVPAVLNQSGLIIETFQEQDLLVNITHHELVPKHVLLSPLEKQALLARYRLKESQLPRIQTGDPVAKYLGLRRGQVVKIIRKSETAGRYASYRWAI
ncbi:DNA-directed RNA polymerases II 24 kDa polypeptide (RNA polymerase II subunit 5) [Puttea exsequens]|nr:DNA-directed RNA polymerases II 24 kDa polypeptide (RNA polymerase II subunit 5) [Puttea exsequens]